jgi:hypothetical protein
MNTLVLTICEQNVRAHFGVTLRQLSKSKNVPNTTPKKNGRREKMIAIGVLIPVRISACVVVVTS